MIRKELSFVKAALFIFLLFDVSSGIESQVEEAHVIADPPDPVQVRVDGFDTIPDHGHTSIAIPQSPFPKYLWKLAPGAHVIADPPDPIEVVDGFDTIPDRGYTSIPIPQSAFSKYSWKLPSGAKKDSINQADQRKSAIPIKDETNGVLSTDYSQDGKQGRRYLTQDKGNMNNQLDRTLADKRQLVSPAINTAVGGGAIILHSPSKYLWPATDGTGINSTTQANQRKSTMPIQDKVYRGPSTAYSQDGQQERRYLTQDEGNMNNRPDRNIARKRQFVAYNGIPGNQSAGKYFSVTAEKSAIPKDEKTNGGHSSYYSEPDGQQEHRSLIPDPLTKRNKIRKTRSNRYQRK